MHAPTQSVARVGRSASRIARSTGLALRMTRHIGHRLRYLPLVLATVGALMVTLGPQSRPTSRDVIGDNSMAPGLAAGELIIVEQHAFVSTEPRLGEIVAFHPPTGEACARRPAPASACQAVANRHEAGVGIKRVVAGPGDEVAMRAGHLIRNARLIREPYDRLPCVQQAICDLRRGVTVPPGTWWLLADNRNAPNDSRRYGPIPTAWITGIVRAVSQPSASPSASAK